MPARRPVGSVSGSFGVVVTVLREAQVLSKRRLIHRVVVATLASVVCAALPAVTAAQTTKKAPAQKSVATVKRTSASAAQRARTTRAARAAAAARARAAALARQRQEAMTPKFAQDALGNLVPEVRAAAAIIYNPQTGDVLWESNSHDQRSIASLTKIMTAVTFVADDPDLTERITVTRADVTRASVTYLRAGEVLTLADVLHLTLIASDNAAARVLARVSEGGTVDFVRRMNDMATHLGLSSSRYADPSGLDSRNVSSAYDLSHLIAFATADGRLGPIMRKAQFNVQTSRRAFTIHSTNKLLGTDVDVVGGKTGFISKAGYCLATLLQVPQGSQLAVVVLGATNSTMRFWEARHLLNWATSRMEGLLSTPVAAATAVPLRQ